MCGLLSGKCTTQCSQLYNVRHGRHICCLLCNGTHANLRSSNLFVNGRTVVCSGLLISSATLQSAPEDCTNDESFFE